MYLQDCLSEFHQLNCPERFEFPKTEAGKVLIVDLGSWQCRAGWAGDSEPSRKGKKLIKLKKVNYFAFVVVFDSTVHRWKREEDGAICVKVGRFGPSGSLASRATARSPFENGILVHTPSAESIFDFIFGKLRCGDQKIKVLVSEPFLNPPFCRAELQELLLEGYSFIESVGFFTDALALSQPQLPAQLIISIGASSTLLSPLLDGHVVIEQVRRLNWGTAVAVDYFSKLLALKYPGLLTSSTSPYRLTPMQAQCLWQRCAFFASSVQDYEAQLSAIAQSDAALKSLDLTVKLHGNAATEAALTRQAAAAQKAAQISAAQLAEKRKILAEKLKQRSEEQRAAKLKSKAHIYETLQGLVDRVTALLQKKTNKKQVVAVAEEDDISMEFSEDESVDEEEEDQDGAHSANDIEFSTWPSLKKEPKLAQELKRFGYKRLSALQNGLKAAEEDLLRAQGIEIAAQPVEYDFSLLAVPDAELSEAQVKEKRRLRLIKSSAEARDRMRAEKAAAEEEKARNAAALAWRRANDLPGWRAELYGRRAELIAALARRQKQRADRKGSVQGSRFRSLMALGPVDDEAVDANVPEHGPDDGFGMNDDDWLVYRQVSKEDEDEADVQDSEALAASEQLLDEGDREEFYRVLQAEQDASITLLQKLRGTENNEEDQSTQTIPAIHINVERLRCTEGLFQPASLHGIDQAGLSELISGIFAFNAALAQNVLVCGGGARIPGLAERLENELRALLPLDCELKINLEKDLSSPWKSIAKNSKETNWISK